MARSRGLRDSRIDVYRNNARRIPSVCGKVIPEPIYTRRAYEGELLDGIYRDIAPHDPDGILQYEWLNARGCIARFDRGSIEIRLLDIQECPKADLAIVVLVVELVRALTQERWGDQASLRALDMVMMSEVLTQTTRLAEEARIDYVPFLRMLGIKREAASAGEVWRNLIDELMPTDSPLRDTLDVLCVHGTLSTRILKAMGPAPDRAAIDRVYLQLADCLQNNVLFTA